MDVRLQVLHAATKLFAAHGFDGTSLQDIAAAVGIRKPSLLYHYPSKEALRLAVLDNVLERWNDVLPRLLMVAAGGEPPFAAVMDELVAFFTADPDRARLLVREILDRPADMRQRVTTHVTPWVNAIADYIRRGQQRGDIHTQVDPEAYVLQVVNMVVSGVATATSLAGALLPESSGPTERHTRELQRIARFSLFRAPDARDSRIIGDSGAAERTAIQPSGAAERTAIQPSGAAERTARQPSSADGERASEGS